MFWFFGPEACAILASWPGMEPTTPLALQGKSLTTGLPGKSLEVWIYLNLYNIKLDKSKSYICNFDIIYLSTIWREEKKGERENAIYT